MTSHSPHAIIFTGGKTIITISKINIPIKGGEYKKMNPTKLINRIDGIWTTCTSQEYNSQDTANFMFSKSDLTNTTTYYKKIG